MFLSLLTYLEGRVSGSRETCSFTPTVGRIALVQELRRPPTRQKRMRQVWESIHPDRVNESEMFNPEVLYHLDDTMFRRRLCKV